MSIIATVREERPATSPAAFRRKARAYLRAAEESRDSWVRAELRHLAREFLRCADELEAAAPR